MFLSLSDSSPSALYFPHLALLPSVPCLCVSPFSSSSPLPSFFLPMSWPQWTDSCRHPGPFPMPPGLLKLHSVLRVVPRSPDWCGEVSLTRKSFLQTSPGLGARGEISLPSAGRAGTCPRRLTGSHPPARPASLPQMPAHQPQVSPSLGSLGVTPALSWLSGQLDGPGCWAVLLHQSCISFHNSPGTELSSSLFSQMGKLRLDAVL